MLTKNKVIETISKFPDQFSLDELVDRMILIQKVEQGLEESENSQITSDEDLDKEVNSWFQ
ncbi:MAG TPA: hypothetical protein VKA27_03945 [Sunxiuqinia sp.]|nr:hypothetical protein [Sunxiuqinia sp.]